MSTASSAVCPFLKDRDIRRVQWAAREVAMATILLCTVAQAAKGQEEGEGESTHTYMYIVHVCVYTCTIYIHVHLSVVNYEAIFFFLSHESKEYHFSTE